MERLNYLDFELKIEREGDNYAARVISSPAGEASSTFILPFSEEKLENLLLKIGRVRSSTRRIHTAEMEAARELGGKLFEAIFGGELRACLRRSLEEAKRQKGVGLRLKLRLQDVAELADLPWEFLRDTSFNRFLAQSNQTPIVRYIEMPERIKPFTLQLPLQMLVMISSPADHSRLDVDREKALLQKALHSLSEQEKVVMKWLEKPTLAALQRCLRDDEYHVFHFIGHGGFDTKAEVGALVLEDEQGRGWQVGAERLGTILHDHRSLRLAVLNACEGARNSRTDPFAGVATTLIQQDIPAVVAMQFEITDDAAITFANEFYTALAEGFPVDAAVAEARKAIYAQPNDVEWGTPVLYMRSSDGVLFNLTQQVPAEEAPPFTPQPSSAREEAPKGGKPDEGRSLVEWYYKFDEETKRKIWEEAGRRAREEAQQKKLERSQQAKSEPSPLLQESSPDLKTPSEPQVIFPRVRVLKGHTKSVKSVAFSPDGKLLASGSGGLLRGNKYLLLWRVSDGELLRELRPTGGVTRVTFSPDGTTLASGSSKTVRLWRVSDGELLRDLKGHKNEVISVAFSPDGKLLAIGSGGSIWDNDHNTIWLWRVSDGEILNVLTGHSEEVTSVAFSPDGTTLASGSRDHTVRLWRVSGKQFTQLQGHTEGVESIAFSPDGRLLASGSGAVLSRGDDTIRLWRVSDGELLRELKGHTGSVKSVNFSPDGTVLASGSGDKSVRLWRVSDGELLRDLKGHTNSVHSVNFSPDGTVLASVSWDNSVLLWRVSDGELVGMLEGHSKSVNCVVFSPDGTLLASGSEDKTVRLWQLR